MIKVYEIICWCIIPTILVLHFIYWFLDDNSKYQKHKLRSSLEQIFKYIASITKEGDRYPEVKVIYKNKEFAIGIYKKEHNFRYTTYEIFINGDKAGMFHIVGDYCCHYHYFETDNNRYKFEVMAIIHAGAKEVKKLNKSVTEKKGSWNEYSYFK